MSNAEASAIDSLGPAPEAIRHRRRSVAAGAVVSMLAGLVLSALPHFIWWARIGEPVFLADYDDQFYLAYTSQAYFEHPLRITDPALRSGGTSQLPPLQLVPPILVAKALDLGPLGVLLVWRIWAGLSIGLLAYLLSLAVLKRPWAAAAVAVLFVSDVGTFVAKPVVKHLELVAKTAARGLTVADIGRSITYQWRLITPAVSLAFLLAHALLTLQARTVPSRRRIVAAGVSYGLLFYVYFYYWTASTVALGFLWLLDAGRRRVPLAVGVIGGVLGLPALWVNWRFKHAHSSDWLIRLDEFLPIPRLSEARLPIAIILILAISVPWAIARRRDLLYLACLAVAGLVMMNHQVVTGLAIQNWHWFYVYAPCTWLLVVFELAPAIECMGAGTRWKSPIVAAVLLAFFGTALGFRWIESIRSADTIKAQAEYVAYRDQKRLPTWPTLTPNECAAGAADFLEIAPILDDLRPLDHYVLLASPDTLEAEWEDRVALNAVLLGTPADEFGRSQDASLSKSWGPWRRDPQLRKQKVERLLSRFEHARAEMLDSAKRFEVRYLAIKAGSSAAHLQGRWKRIQAGPTWDLYENLDLPTAPAPRP